MEKKGSVRVVCGGFQNWGGTEKKKNKKKKSQIKNYIWVKKNTKKVKKNTTNQTKHWGGNYQKPTSPGRHANTKQTTEVRPPPPPPPPPNSERKKGAMEFSGGKTPKKKKKIGRMR